MTQKHLTDTQLNIKNNLRAFRENLGLKQNEFAQSINVLQSTLAWAEGYKSDRGVPDSILYGVLKVYGYDLVEDKQLFTPQKDINKKRKIDISDKLKNFGKELIKIQAENNLDPVDMAKILDISESRYEKIALKGVVPYFDEIIALVENFNVSLDRLFLDIGAEIKQAPPKNLSQKELEILKVIKLAKENKLI